MTVTDLKQYLGLVPTLRDSPTHNLWSSYDPEADVLYINFKKPNHAIDSELTNDVIVRYKGDDIIGLTILHASHR